MKEKSSGKKIKKEYRLLLAFGILLLLTGTVLQICSITGYTINRYIVSTCVSILAGGFLLYFAFIHNHSFWCFFLGFAFAFCGIFLLMLCEDLTKLQLKDLWPVFVIIAGITTFLSALFSKRKITFSVIIPSLVLILLGIFFLLFSLHVIKISFRFFAAIWWPAILILAGAILLGIFLYFQSGKRTVPIEISDDNDED